MSAYQYKYFQNIQFKNHGIAPTPPDLPTLKAYPTPRVGGRFGIFSLKWRERMNLKVPGATLPLGCAILSTRARTVRGVGTTPPLRELGLKKQDAKYSMQFQDNHHIREKQVKFERYMHTHKFHSLVISHAKRCIKYWINIPSSLRHSCIKEAYLANWWANIRSWGWLQIF